MFRVKDGAELASLKAQDPIRQAAWDPQGRFVAFVDNAKGLYLWAPWRTPAYIKNRASNQNAVVGHFAPRRSARGGYGLRRCRVFHSSGKKEISGMSTSTNNLVPAVTPTTPPAQPSNSEYATISGKHAALWHG
jgi:hypothetical protein